jgi:hypothetical protein
MTSPVPFRAVRFVENPVIHAGLPGLAGEIGSNLNGPSLIRVPSWVANPLGRYYLYFAHHHGTYVRLAFAERPEGPWAVLPGGVLPLESTAAHDHVASPDAHVDDEARTIRLYVHGCGPEGRAVQVSFVATSADGLHFTARPDRLGPFYFRVFRHDGWHYALAKEGNESGRLLRSRDGLAPFEPGPLVIPRMRHAAVAVRGDVLDVVCTRIGDAPEQLLYTAISLASDWHGWRPGALVPLLAPELDWEGAGEPLAPSRPGRAFGRERALRDPALLRDEDGRLLLVYAVAGEQGLALAELQPWR